MGVSETKADDWPLIYSSIDIGTNTVLLLVAERNDDAIQILSEQQLIPRLGQGVDKHRNLSEAAMERTTDALLEFQQVLELFDSESIRPLITSTSAVRDAANRDTFIQKIRNRTGWDVDVLTGKEEAELTFAGALSVLDIRPEEYVSVLDIGGGSTEIASGTLERLDRMLSLDIGCVRFTERYFKHDPPSGKEIQNATAEIRRIFSSSEISYASDRIIGVAGTVTSLAAIDQGLTGYHAEKLNGYLLTENRIQDFLDEFSEMASGELENRYPVFLKGRSDIILAGLMILLEFLQNTGQKALTVSAGGIRHGVILREIKKAGYSVNRLSY
jgi:exopolyphosphatase / guanosine-5'-triphosphate,3'-diphosphate pyrophosphatase